MCIMHELRRRLNQLLAFSEWWMPAYLDKVESLRQGHLVMACMLREVYPRQFKNCKVITTITKLKWLEIRPPSSAHVFTRALPPPPTTTKNKMMLCLHPDKIQNLEGTILHTLSYKIDVEQLLSLYTLQNEELQDEEVRIRESLYYQTHILHKLLTDVSVKLGDGKLKEIGNWTAEIQEYNEEEEEDDDEVDYEDDVNYYEESEDVDIGYAGYVSEDGFVGSPDGVEAEQAGHEHLQGNVNVSVNNEQTGVGVPEPVDEGVAGGVDEHAAHVDGYASEHFQGNDTGGVNNEQAGLGVSEAEQAGHVKAQNDVGIGEHGEGNHDIGVNTDEAEPVSFGVAERALMQNNIVALKGQLDDSNAVNMRLRQELELAKRNLHEIRRWNDHNKKKIKRCTRHGCNGIDCRYFHGDFV